MTQPPDQQPPQGGFGAPQDPPPQAPTGPPQAPQGPPPQSPPPPQGAPQMPPQAPPGPPGAAQPGSAQPGYGYPQQPPAQPGYGYPQAPQPGPYGQQPPQSPPGQQPGPYAQPGPYGQQPGPYGQQAGPYAQQPGPYGQQAGPYGGGYPPQQYPGAPTPPPGGGSGSGGGKDFFKGKPGIIVASAAAALLVIGGGTWFALSGDDEGGSKPVAGESGDAKRKGSSGIDKGDGTGGGRAAEDDLNAGRKDGESKISWLQTNDVDLPRNGADVYGPWIVGDTVVKAMFKSIAGYSAADGKKKWTLTLPAEVCAAPQTPTADGKLVIAYKSGTSDKAKCNQLQMVDATNGKGGWKKEVAERGNFDMLGDITLAISGDTVTAARTGNSDAYRVSDGTELFGKLPGECQPYAFAGGAKLIAAESCPTADYDTEQNQIQELDPATGKAKWTYKLKENWTVDKAYSVNPLVVSVKNDDEKSWSILALNADGSARSQIDGGDDKFAPRCVGSFVVFGENLEGCTGVAADANTFYMSTEPDESGSSATNEVVAFNLDTGKAKWRSKAPEGREMEPMGMEDGKVLVYMSASYNEGGSVATIAPTGGAPKVIQRHPAATSEIESSFYSPKMLYADGRFYLASGRVSASSDEEEKQTKTMMAFED
ncbi:outer membrane protein assembly factor BamB family protein [Streptomyces hebeiensis]